MCHHLVFVAWRQQRRQQDDVRHTRAERRDRPIARVDDDQLGVHALVDDPRKYGCLPLVWHNWRVQVQRVCLSTSTALLVPLRRQRSV